jgi:hypothetical protein
MRSEQMERIRRTAVREHADATRAGGTHAYDSARPWAYVWEKAAEQSDPFWKEEVEDVRVQALAQASAISKALGYDAPIAGGAAPAALRKPPPPGPGGGAYGGYPGQQQFLQLPPGGGPPPPKKPRHHNVSNGAYQTNRMGNALCPDFAAAGTCTRPLVGVAKSGCEQGAHQRGRCLSRDHGKSGCRVPKDPPNKKKGSGKGKRNP